MTERYRPTSLGELAHKLDFEDEHLEPATRYFEIQKQIGREATIDELIEVTRDAFPFLGWNLAK
jgi:hypothetical protein